MIINKNLTLSENQAITADAISENVIRWNETGKATLEAGQIVRNIGSGTAVPMLIQVTENFATLTSLEITLETSDSADLSSSTVLASSGAIPVASLLAGYRPAFTRHVPDATMLDFLGLRFNVNGSNATAGKISAAVATEVNS